MADLAFLGQLSDEDRLQQAENLVRSYCGWHIAPSRTVTVRMAGSRGSTHVLPSLHVTDVESVTYDGQLLDPANYTWTQAGVLTHRGLWMCRTLEVTFTHGYASPPPEVTAVVLAVADRAAHASPNVVQVGQVRYSDSGGSTFGILGEWRDAIDRYRLPKLP